VVGGEPPGDSGAASVLFVAWCLAKGWIPPGGLDLFRPTTLGAVPGRNPVDVDLCLCCVLINDAILGSGDAMP